MSLESFDKIKSRKNLTERDSREFANDEEEHFVSLLEQLLQGSSDSTQDILGEVQEMINNNQNVVELLTIKYILAIFGYVDQPEFTYEVFYTLSVIQTNTIYFNDFFKSEEFIQPVASMLSSCDERTRYTVTALLSNVLIDDPAFQNILIENGIVEELIFNPNEKQTSETKRFISIILDNEETDYDLFVRIFNSQIDFIKEYIELPGTANEPVEVEEYEINEKDEERERTKFLKRIFKKKPLINSMHLVLNDYNQKVNEVTRKCQFLSSYMLNNNLVSYLRVIANLQLEQISSMVLDIFEIVSKWDSSFNTFLFNSGFVEDLKILISSSDEEISTSALRCFIVFEKEFAILTKEAHECFYECNLMERFNEGGFYTKQSVILFLTELVDDCSDEEMMSIFTEDFCSTVMEFIDIGPEEKVSVYCLVGRILSNADDCEWILSILDNLDFWDIAEDDRFNETNETVSRYAAEVISIHETIIGSP